MLTLLSWLVTPACQVEQFAGQSAWRLVAWKLPRKRKRTKRVCVTMWWSSSASTLILEPVVTPWNSSVWVWRHSFGLALTLMQSEFVATHGRDVSVIKGDEETLSSIVHSTRFSHPYVKWVFVFSGCCSSAKKSLLCQKQNDPEADPSSVAQLCVSLINDKWPSVCVAFSLENSLTLNRSLASADSKTDRVCLDASSFCPVGTPEILLFFFPVPWSWECNSTFSREGRFLHLPKSSETVSVVSVWSANELENSLQFLSSHSYGHGYLST